MKPWQPGDPVATGAVYLPTDESRAAYGEAVKRLQIESWALGVIAKPSINDRRAALEKCPRKLRHAVEARVIELWKQKQNRGE